MLGTAAKQRKTAAAAGGGSCGGGCLNLSPDLLANIHGRLSLVDRLAFAAVFGATCGDVIRPEEPWLVLPGGTPETATLFSLSDRCGATVCSPDPALRGHVVLGSSCGWLATADDRGRMRLVNPVTGEQHELPDITTMGVFKPSTNYHWFSVVIRSFLEIRFGGPQPFDSRRWGREGYGTHTFTADDMRRCFYRKVVLSASPRPGCYAAMLILGQEFGAPAFTTAEDAAWSLAPSRDGVEDAIHHRGQFYSITYSGVVEAWEHDAAGGTKFTSTVIAPRLANEVDEDDGGDSSCRRKYLVAVPDGRLMVVRKDSKETKDEHRRGRWTCSFKVHVLDGDGKVWKEVKDIGEAALFVGMKNSLCVSTRELPELKAGGVYFTDDDVGQERLRKGAHNYHDDPVNWAAGVYSLKDGTVEKIEALGQHHGGFWPPPAWITPSIP